MDTITPVHPHATDEAVLRSPNRSFTFLPPTLFQIFTTAESVLHTKMSIDDLSMVTAPAILRCPYEDPRLICENMKKEMAFIRTLMTYLDTSFMEDII